MVPMFPNDIQPGAECMVVGFKFFTPSMRNLGKRVRSVREVEPGLWLCKPLTKGFQGVNTKTGLIGIKTTWLMKISDPTSGLKGNIIPIHPTPNGAARLLHA